MCPNKEVGQAVDFIWQCRIVLKGSGFGNECGQD